MNQPPPDYGQPPPGYGQPPPPGYGYQQQAPPKGGGYNACCCRKYDPPRAGCAVVITDLVFSILGVISWLALLFGVGVNDIYNIQKNETKFWKSLNLTDRDGRAYVPPIGIASVRIMCILTLIMDLILIALCIAVIVTLKRMGIFGTWSPAAWFGFASIRIIFWIVFLAFWAKKGDMRPNPEKKEDYKKYAERVKNFVPSGAYQVAQHYYDKINNNLAGPGRAGPDRRMGEDYEEGPGTTTLSPELQAKQVGANILKYFYISILALFMLIYVWLIAIMVGYFLFKLVNRNRPVATNNAEFFNPEPMENPEAPPTATPSATGAA